MRLIYIAGPYTPTEAQKAQLGAPDGSSSWFAARRKFVRSNIDHAERLAVEVVKLGYMILCPHSNTAIEEYEALRPAQFWIDGTLELLKRCDALITTDNWEESSGARGEVSWCESNGVPAFHSLDELKAFNWDAQYEPGHVDHFIDDFRSDPYARWMLHHFRLPAILSCSFRRFIGQLFCTFEGARWQCVGASRMGDVWLTKSGERDARYERRVDVLACADWSDKP